MIKQYLRYASWFLCIAVILMSVLIEEVAANENLKENSYEESLEFNVGVIIDKKKTRSS